VKLRDKIFAAKDIKEEKVLVPEWDTELLIKGLNGKDRSDLLAACIDMKTGSMDLEKLYPMLIIATAYDPETGEKVFEATDRDQINTKSGGALEKVGQVAMKLSGLNKDDLENAKKN
jgi:hypothetical protein